MLAAIAADFARVDDCRVTTLWDERLGPCPVEEVDVVAVGSTDEAMGLFRRYAMTSDATFCIAPELDGILVDRRQIVDDVGGTYLGPSADAMALCADKLQLAEHLSVAGIRTIPTQPLADADDSEERPLPAVVKRRDGTGSLGIQTLRTASEWRALHSAIGSGHRAEQMIVQPLVQGRHLSVAAIIGPNRVSVEVFPPGEQLLSDDGEFRYLGGRIPVEPTVQESAADLVRSAVAAIPGLAGYVGFDILLPDAPAAEPLLVEINPRLTTSYLGYRALAEENLAERLLFPERGRCPIRWKSRDVEFSPAGVIRQLN